jgi:hypothetical protein
MHSPPVWARICISLRLNILLPYPSSSSVGYVQVSQLRRANGSGYLLLQVPSNMILHRTRPRFYLPGTMLAWGCMVLVYLAVSDAGGLIAVRLCLRIIEAGFFVSA